MHVLRQLHRSLRRNGILLDVHPLPEDPRVEVQRLDGSVPVGAIDWSQDSREIRQARRRLTNVERAGLFAVEERRIFEAAMYHQSVDAWLEYRRDHEETSVIPTGTLRAARARMRARGSVLVVRERVRASVFRRLDGAGRA